VNVDYSVCNALNFNSSGLQEGLIIYDINCQFLIHFEDRIAEVDQYLELDPRMKILGAVGKFHLADHVDSCFSKWTLNFLKGAGHIDGEIMETLWSGMNKVSAAARSMTKAHRQETLDDYMRDSNWKKTVGIGKFLIIEDISYLTYYCFLVTTLLTKHKRCLVGLDSTKPAFDQLTDSCLERQLPVEIWKSSEHSAMEERGEKLKIFDIYHKKLPTLAEITLRLTDIKGNPSDKVKVVDWISNGIKAENDQWVVNLISYLV